MAQAGSAADESTVRGAVQEWWRKLCPGADQRNKLDLGGSEPRRGATEREACACLALSIARWRMATVMSGGDDWIGFPVNLLSTMRASCPAFSSPVNLLLFSTQKKLKEAPNKY